jgi:hypothetical protein
MRGAMVQLQPDTVRQCGHIGHLCIEPHIGAHRASFGEKDFSEPPSAESDARRAELCLVVRLRREGETVAFGVADFDVGGVDAARLDRLIAADGSQPVHAVGRQGQEHPSLVVAVLFRASNTIGL